MLSCQRCKQTTNGPQAFLLTCRGCNKTWHHRCHQPAVEDGELIGRIRATNAGDTANGLGAWACRRCRKGASETPSAMSSRAPTVSSDSREERKTSAAPVATSSVPPTVEVHVKRESNAVVDARLLHDQERQASREVVPVKPTFSAKSTKSSAASRSHVPPQAQPRDVEMADDAPPRFTPQDKKMSPQRLSLSASLLRAKGARKFVGTVPATSSEDDVEMETEDTPSSLSEPTSRAISHTSQAPSSDDQAIRRTSIVEATPHVRAANAQEREARPAGGGVVQSGAARDAADDDDPEDLYGPPVERRIIRILPSLAEELREQRRRTPSEKEERRAPLAPDWIYAKHAHDPLWEKVPSQGRKGRKTIAKKLGENGLNVDELMGCFTIQNWIRERKN